ncbi:hypothetical protein [Runella sp.]|uniref:Ig-like domain-containing protein n=1 Tax=Runella sp. TaxID=1960881 RepID=UPI003D143BC7
MKTMARDPLLSEALRVDIFQKNADNELNINDELIYLKGNFEETTVAANTVSTPKTTLYKTLKLPGTTTEETSPASSSMMSSGQNKASSPLKSVSNACTKPNAGKDSTICRAVIQLVAPAQGETWTFLSSNNSTTASVTASGLASGLSVTGQYKFVLKQTQDDACSDTVTITRANFIISAISDKSICPGEILTFGYQGLSGVTYLWSTGVSTPTVTVAPVQTTDYTVKVTSQSTGCVSNDTIKVAVLPKPNAGKDTLICGNSVKLNAAGAGETWSFLSFNDPNTPGNTATASIDNQGNVSGIAKNGFYRFVLTNGQTCTDTIRVQKTSVSLPDITLTPICPGAELTFGYTNAVDFTYLWSTGETTPQIKVSPDQTTDYYVTVTSVQNKCSVKDTVTVPVKSTSVLTLVTSVCAPNNLTYATTVTVTNGAVVTSNAGIVTGSGTSFIVTVGSDTTQYTITATLAGCKTKLTVTKPDCTCPQIAAPTATSSSVCGGGTVALSGSGCAAGTTAKWYSNLGLTAEVGSGAGFTTPTLTQTTDYYVACVSDAKPACKSSGVKVTATVKQVPSFSAVSATCSAGNTTYSVTTSSTGTVGVKTPNGLNVTGSGPYIVSGITAGQNLVLTATLNGCSKDTTITAPSCVSDCPTITITKATDTLCSGYYGDPIMVNVSDTSKIVRFVYFTTPQTGTGMYLGGTLIEEIKPFSSTVGVPNGQPGLQLPANTTGAPIKYYVYAIFKTPPTGSPNCFPFAEKVYTVLPLPKFELDSIPACTGDTTYTVNLKITSAGNFTVYVAGSFATIGNGPIPGNVSQTLTTIQGGGQITALKISTTGNHYIIVKDANGCASVLAAPVPSFKPCNGVYDVALKKSVSTKIPKVGDNITYTIKVWNEGDAKATNVSVKDTLNAGVQYVTYASATGNYNAATKIWTLGDLAPGDTAVLQLVVKVIAQGVWFNTAEICGMTEKDLDSTPCNGDESEDDLDRKCISVPLEVCTGEAIQVSVPGSYQDVKWYKDGQPAVIAVGNVFLASEPGTYTFTAAQNTCPAQGCCPIIILAGTNCCLPDLCIPFTVHKSKKGGKSL